MKSTKSIILIVVGVVLAFAVIAILPDRAFTDQTAGTNVFMAKGHQS